MLWGSLAAHGFLRDAVILSDDAGQFDVGRQVTKRKISGGTQSTAGRDCRDAFLALAKTCAKLGVSFWDYLGNRLGTPGRADIPRLPDLVRLRANV